MAHIKPVGIITFYHYYTHLRKRKGVNELEPSGAGGGIRTLNPLQAQDFKSCAYANSATPAYKQDPHFV